MGGAQTCRGRASGGCRTRRGRAPGGGGKVGAGHEGAGRRPDTEGEGIERIERERGRHGGSRQEA